MPSRHFVLVLCGLATFLGAIAAAPQKPPLRPPLSVVEATIPELQAALNERRVTARELVLQYLSRIAVYDNQLHAVMAVNREALRQADELDRERAAGRLRGPLQVERLQAAIEMSGQR